jgi:hypothetical protein
MSGSSRLDCSNQASEQAIGYFSSLKSVSLNETRPTDHQVIELVGERVEGLVHFNGEWLCCLDSVWCLDSSELDFGFRIKTNSATVCTSLDYDVISSRIRLLSLKVLEVLYQISTSCG